MKFHVLFIVITLLTACSDIDNSISDTVKLNAAKRQLNFDKAIRGHQLYLQHCAQCHGKQAEATPDWRKPGADGKYPPPPLNGTAHTWHHTQSVLHDIIKNGTLRLGGSMPAWKDKLSDKDIDDILEWIKASWPDQIYQAWQKRNMPSK